MHSPNLDEWLPSPWISPCSPLHNSPLRPAAHSRDIQYCLRYVMEIEENKVEKEKSRSHTVYDENLQMDLYAVYCRQKAPEPDGAKSFIGHMT